ncbi:MAG TPA: T9SS type A sorting domain-containing protein, partial [Bacteroidia bacterium]|nr:T9SS type A sorting domain-containing protein [Bacteroidia bacterium]
GGGGGGSSFPGSTFVSGGITFTPSSNLQGNNSVTADSALAPGGAPTGIGTGGYQANGGNGLIVITWTVPTALSSVTAKALTNELCNGGNIGSAFVTIVTGNAAPFTYAWSPSAQTTDTATGLTAGTYTVTVKDNCGNSATASATITEPAVLKVSTGSVVNIFCNGGNNGKVMATPSGGTAAYNYSWSDANTQTVATATGLTAGSYTVTVTDANGCSTTASSTITEPTALTVSTGFTENILCNGGNNGKTLATPSGGTGAYTYSWAPGGQTSASAANLTAGTYTVAVKDANGCSATATASITEPTALTLTGSATDTAICKGKCTDVNATAGGGSPSYTYAWNTGATTSSVNVCPLVKTTYSVTLNDANGCSNTATVTVDVNPCLGVNEVASLDDMIKFYPNPFTQSVNVDISVSGPVTVTIFNMMGQNVGAYTMDKGLNTINTSNLSSGIYMMQVKTQNGILNKKLVKVD